jgi:hypothetical protein
MVALIHHGQVAFYKRIKKATERVILEAIEMALSSRSRAISERRSML